jgi:hypothetical protein
LLLVLDRSERGAVVVAEEEEDEVLVEVLERAEARWAGALRL